jgi:uncharacterized protein
MNYKNLSILLVCTLFTITDARLRKKSKNLEQAAPIKARPITHPKKILISDEQDYTPLMKAAYNRDPKKVADLIAKKADVNAATGISVAGQTALMIATAFAELGIMNQLIKAGANVNAIAGFDQPSTGKPVLRYAIDSGSVAAVKTLLNAKANPNAFTETGIETNRPMGNERNAPLLSHAIHNNAPIEIIDALIQGGADVNGKALIVKWTPLMVAALKNNEAAIKALLQAGADKTIKNEKDENRTAYDYLKENPNASDELLDLLK